MTIERPYRWMQIPALPSPGFLWQVQRDRLGKFYELLFNDRGTIKIVWAYGCKAGKGAIFEMLLSPCHDARELLIHYLKVATNVSVFREPKLMEAHHFLFCFEKCSWSSFIPVWLVGLFSCHSGYIHIRGHITLQQPTRRHHSVLRVYITITTRL